MNVALLKIKSFPKYFLVIVLLLCVMLSLTCIVINLGADSTVGINKSKVIAQQAKVLDDQEKAAEAANVQAKFAGSSKVLYPPIIVSSPKGRGLYVDPALGLAGRPLQIASQPIATWYGGWTVDIAKSVNGLINAATRRGYLATVVAYNIPARDCGSYSAGGSGSSADYRLWIRSLAAGIGNRQAIVILEPDALAQITCLSPADQAIRYADLADAVNVLATQTKSFVYLDAGNSNWIDANTMVSRLQRANIAQARGFSLNVANFQTTASSINYGDRIAASTGKGYVIDTSRNGRGSNGQWCNPQGRALGVKPAIMATGYLDAYLWIKQPGQSDGTCNGGPPAGTWSAAYAQELIHNAGY